MLGIIAQFIWLGVGAAFQWILTAFEAVGLSWPVVVTGMAVMAALCRSFFRVWVGDSLEQSMVANRETFFNRVRWRPKYANNKRTFGDIYGRKGKFSKGAVKGAIKYK